MAWTKEEIELDHLAEIATFQDTGLFPHEFTEKEFLRYRTYASVFLNIGLAKANDFVFGKSAEQRMKAV